MLNWLARYAPAVRALEDAGPLGSILDVGCGQHGLACVRPDLPFVGVDVHYAGPAAPSMVALKSEPGPFPWPDHAFDTVICLDSLEHVPRPDRAGFVAELGRVAARRMFIACPSSVAQPFDDLVRDRYRMPDGSPPPWLVEHYEEGLPTPEEIQAAVAAVPGMTAREVAMPDGLLCALLLIADLDPGFMPQSVAEAAGYAGEWAGVLDAARFGSGFRPGYLLERDEPVDALIDPADLEASTIAAMTDTSVMRRVQNLPAPSPAASPGSPVSEGEAQPLATDKALRLWLRPDWGEPLTWVPPLAAYMHAADPAGDVVLCLDGTDRSLHAGQVEALVATVVEQLAGNRPFADVLLMGSDVVREGLTPVADATAVRAALGAGDAAGERSDVEVLWAQVLVDGLRRQADRWRHETAPALEPTVDPVLSVVVVGDDADAAARTVASVEAIGRPRVQLVRPPAGGDPTAQLHAGLVEATGDYVLAVQAGDRLVPAGVWELVRLATWLKRDVVVGAAVDAAAAVPEPLATVALVSRRLAHVGGNAASEQPLLLARLQRLLGLGVPVERTEHLVVLADGPAPAAAPAGLEEIAPL